MAVGLGSNRKPRLKGNNIMDHLLETNPIAYAYENYSINSVGFCQCIETHAGLEISREEIKRIACHVQSMVTEYPDHVKTKSEWFYMTWEGLTFWTDEESDALLQKCREDRKRGTRTLAELHVGSAGYL